MTPFLRRVAEHYYQIYGSDIGQLSFVFPSRRALLFFTRYLAELADRPIFAPRCTTINDFVLSLAPELRVLDKSAQIFELYECYRSIRGEQSEGIDEFLFWGNIILQDFDLIDRYLINPHHLYRNLEGYREMQDDFSYLSDETLELIERFWKGFRNPHKATEAERADYRKSFVDFWLTLEPLYTNFSERLARQGYAYEGHIYRHVAEQCIDKVDQLAQQLGAEPEEAAPQLRYVFVGLFDIKPSEARLLSAMRRRGLAECYWDERVAIVQDEYHPAHAMLRSYKERFGSVSPEPPIDPQTLLPKDIRVYNCASTITQVKALPELIKRLNLCNTPHDPDDLSTAIILPNEQLLLPVASSIPLEYEHLNITLGYPLSRTPVAILLHRWLRLMTARDGAYPVERILSVMTLQLLTDFFPGLQVFATALRRQKRYILSSSWLLNTYLPALLTRDSSETQDLRQAQAIIELLLKPRTDAGDMLEALRQLLDLLGRLITERDAVRVDDVADAPMNFDLEFIYHYDRLTTRLADLIKQYEAMGLSVESVVKLLEGLSLGVSIPFEGDPLRGLQVMGLLESRLLHFSTVIYLSAQEGSLPRKRSMSTLIPHSLRRGFGLPTREWLDAAEAYHFYQSIAEARQLILLYGIDDPLGGKGEVSRYVHQMQMLYGAQVKHISIQTKLEPAQTVVRPISKQRPDVAARLALYSPGSGRCKALSASALSTYMSCPLRFYYEHIEGVREDQSPSVLIAANDFGTILHDTMEELYRPYADGVREVLEQDVAPYLTPGNTAVERTVLRMYRRCYGEDEGTDTDTALSALDTLSRYYVDLISIYVRHVLRYDREQTPFRYLSSEAELSGTFSLSDGRAINIKGKLDRVDLCKIDSIGEAMRILDYKTGGDKKKNISSMAELWRRYADNKAIIQTLFYCELLRSATNRPAKLSEAMAGHQVVPGILLVRQMSKHQQEYSPYISIDGQSPIVYDESIRESFTEQLRSVLDVLFDPSIPFAQTTKVSNCQYCPFRSICSR